MEKEIIKQKKKLMDEFCPGIFEEISGLADSLNVPVGKIRILSDDCINAGACSQFTVMPNITENGEILLGRSYEYSADDELCLSVIRANGKPAHIGFSILIFGRFDGINEHGLTVSMSSCEFRQKPTGNGVFCPYYEDYLGTLYSMVFNVSNADVEVCFGMPARNKWERINFNSPAKITRQTEIIKNEYPENPASFWSSLPQGSMELV